ncbi:MAG: hypothetical protein HY360_07135 [Verrucomicrobia bacterium]|nr:hypothetical protein [Verrucomicrobiota bacterium]
MALIFFPIERWFQGVTVGIRLLGIVFSVAAVHGADISTKLEDMEWDDRQQRTLTRRAIEALSMESNEWHHAESEHFVYHFSERWMAERAASESETYYAQIKEDLKIDQDRWEIKGHIFLFEKEVLWRSFVAKSGIDRWSGGVCSGNEIYLLSPPKAQPFTGTVLPHEMAHLVVSRFVRGHVPVWLSEGFAEQQGRRRFLAYTKPRGHNLWVPVHPISAETYIPLEELTSSSDYPADEAKVRSFYAESLRLAQFLVEDHPKQDFLEFLQCMADGLRFATALDRVYGVQYRDLETFETSFKKVVITKKGGWVDINPQR